MKYALLIYENEQVFGPQKAGPVMDKIVGRHRAFVQGLGAAHVGGAGLKAASTATTVRTKGGVQSIHDGPFAEAREQLGGFHLVEAPDLDAAIAIGPQGPADGGRRDRSAAGPRTRMSTGALDRTFRTAKGRIIAALAARFRDLDLAEDAFADACAKAAETWPHGPPISDPAAWLYRAAERRALDATRRRRNQPTASPIDAAAYDPRDEMDADDSFIPDERLRLIFVCCHPAVAEEARAALTLRLVCGLTTEEIARAFLVSESTLAQRLVRAKRKIAEAGVGYEVPGSAYWPERLEAVLTTLEIAYAKAHEDAAGAGAHAGYATEMLELTRVLTTLLPGETDALALAALIRFAEARRPARVDAAGVMVPLSKQSPESWDRKLIADGQRFLDAAQGTGRTSVRLLQAQIHGVWCARKNLAEAPSWDRVLTLYDAMLALGDNPIVRLNRAVALAEVARVDGGVDAALAEMEAIRSVSMETYLPYLAVRADLLRRGARRAEADAAYTAALALEPGPAEREWLQRQRNR